MDLLAPVALESLSDCIWRKVHGDKVGVPRMCSLCLWIRNWSYRSSIPISSVEMVAGFHCWLTSPGGCIQIDL